MDQDIICGDLPIVKNCEWIDELKRNNIIINDVDPSLDRNIDMLIGADVWGKLMTGQKYELVDGPTAIETRLGWTITEKVKGNQKDDTIALVHDLFINESKISDLWTLDVLGIKDPIEKINFDSKNERVKTNFLKSICKDEKGRFSVELPWKEDFAPLTDNYNLARARLENTLKK